VRESHPKCVNATCHKSSGCPRSGRFRAIPFFRRLLKTETVSLRPAPFASEGPLVALNHRNRRQRSRRRNGLFPSREVRLQEATGAPSVTTTQPGRGCSHLSDASGRGRFSWTRPLGSLTLFRGAPEPPGLARDGYPGRGKQLKRLGPRAVGQELSCGDFCGMVPAMFELEPTATKRRPSGVAATSRVQ